MTSKEEKAIILDFLPNGYPFDTRPGHKKTAIAQAIGASRFALLELVPKKGASLAVAQEVYIGEGKRDEIHHVLGKLPFDKLTGTAQSELKFIVKKLVHENQQKFVDFFNNSGPLSTRMHSLELIPGLGKKHMWDIIEERKEKPFENFDDMKQRVKLMPDPEASIIKRIMKEIEGKEKHRLFSD